MGVGVSCGELPAKPYDAAGVWIAPRTVVLCQDMQVVKLFFELMLTLDKTNQKAEDAAYTRHSFQVLFVAAAKTFTI